MDYPDNSQRILRVAMAIAIALPSIATASHSDPPDDLKYQD